MPDLCQYWPPSQGLLPPRRAEGGSGRSRWSRKRTTRRAAKGPHAGMTRKEKIDLLRRVKLFSGLGSKALGEVADLMTEISFPANRYIVRQGQVGTRSSPIHAGP